MKVFLSVAISAVLLATVSGQYCTQEVNCLLEQQCVCPSVVAPISEVIPQLVTITFNDAISDLYFMDYYEPLLVGRLNPDESPVSATFYVPHEYTDYARVNDLYNLGFEIGVHSITKNPSVEYWSNADVSTLVQEFEGQRQIINQFANIPIEDVIGARVPNFEMAGDNLFEAYQQSGIEYDNSWTMSIRYRYFPFSMDYNNYLECRVGICPSNTYPGIWVAPVNDLEANGFECNNLQGCLISGTVEEISDWLYEQFLNVYEGNRAPITLAAGMGWFLSNENSYEALGNFLDRIAAFDDVFMVSHKQVIDFMKNPVDVNSYVPSSVGNTASCLRRQCMLDHNDMTETRYMVSCVSCPFVYPWLGNPMGIIM